MNVRSTKHSAMTRWGSSLAIVGVTVTAIAAATALAFWDAGHPAQTNSGRATGLTLAHVKRGTLTVKVTGGGTLAGTPAPLATGTRMVGTATDLPAVGTVVDQGQVIYRIDNQPVILLYGNTPVFRAFGPGMTVGQDLVQLEQDLIQLGYGQPYGLLANGDFNFSDEQAVRAFNKAEGLPSGDQLALGAVLFEPGPVVVAADSVGLGASVAAGTAVVSLEMDTPEATMQLSSAQASGITAGTPALVTLSSPSEILNGKVSSVVPSSGSNVNVTVSLNNPPASLSLAQRSVFVEFDVQTLPNVYIVPVSALVATVGGQYALQEALGGGRSTLIAVSVGALDNIDGLAQVSGPQLRAGLPVESAQ